MLKRIYFAACVPFLVAAVIFLLYWTSGTAETAKAEHSPWGLIKVAVGSFYCLGFVWLTLFSAARAVLPEDALAAFRSWLPGFRAAILILVGCPAYLGLFIASLCLIYGLACAAVNDPPAWLLLSAAAAAAAGGIVSLACYSGQDDESREVAQAAGGLFGEVAGPGLAAGALALGVIAVCRAARRR